MNKNFILTLELKCFLQQRYTFTFRSIEKTFFCMYVLRIFENGCCIEALPHI